MALAHGQEAHAFFSAAPATATADPMVRAWLEQGFTQKPGIGLNSTRAAAVSPGRAAR